MDRTIAHFDIPNFYATLEELRDPTLKKRPLALAEPRPRALLQGVNAIARIEGLAEGMNLAQARRFCGRLHVIPPDYRFYASQHSRILDFFGSFSPLVEGTLPGRYFADITGTRRLWGPPTDVVSGMERGLAERNNILASAGLARNKLVSRVAARVISPGDLGFVLPGGESVFLAPLPVNYLPGVGPKTSALLLDFNIRQIGELADVHEDSLSAVFGRQGFRLVQIARGIDTTPVVPSRKTPGISVNRILDRDEIDRERLEGLLLQQVEEAAWTLRRCNRYARELSLEIRYADGVAARKRTSLPPDMSATDLSLFRITERVFKKIFTRRVAVRRISLELRKLTIPSRQLTLFPVDDGGEHLQGALDTIRDRFGRESISWGRAVIARTGLTASRELEASLAA